MIASFSCSCLHHPTLIINIIIMITFYESLLHVRQIVRYFQRMTALWFSIRKSVEIPPHWPSG